MPDDHSQRAYELFEAVMEKQENQRSDFLEQACAGDDTLRTEVESLIAADAKADDFLEPSPRGQESGPPTGEPGVARVGARFGAYHIRGVIAAGGMGTVYEAVQEHPRRTVALKALRRGIASRSALRRFEHESQILARLRHPCIAQVYEAGTYDDPGAPGERVPYFAMEYIPGARPITRYATDRDLGTRERLELFAQVCDAVHHGHQKGIIHRDLKPGNLLVNSAGQVKIIDFGVARSTDSDMAVTTQQTDIGQLIGTLQYMSPEQCQGDPHDIDTRSDVYALGAVLYELLCGRPPYDVAHKGLHEATRTVCEQRPIRPSAINRALRGDVETIVLKALEKDRERRYRSVAELEEDIKRYLRNDPIIARPPSITYQLRVFARRNRTLFGAVAAVFTMLVGGIIVSTSLYVRAERARAEAQRAWAQSEAVTDFLINDLLTSASPKKEPNRDLSVREVLDQASKAIERKFQGQPLVEAKIQMTLGNTYRTLGEYEQAEEHLNRALELRQTELGEAHPDTLESMSCMGGLLLDQGKLNESESFLREALERRRRVLGGDHPDTLDSISFMGLLLRAQGKLNEAEPFYREALEGKRRILGDDHPSTLASISNMGFLLNTQGKPNEAEPFWREALERRRRVLGDDHPHTLVSINSMGFLLQAQGKLTEAEPFYREALERRRRVLGDDHPSTLVSINNMGFLLNAQGRLTEAQPFFREARERSRRILGDDHPNTLVAMGNMGDLLQAQGKLNEAETLSREVLEGRRRVLGDEHPDTLSSVHNLGHVLNQLERYAEARDLLAEGEAAARVAWTGPNARKLGYYLGWLGRARGGVGEFSAGEATLLEAYELLADGYGPNHERTLRCVEHLILLYDGWHATEPGAGHDVQAAEWRAKLAEPVEDLAARRP